MRLSDLERVLAAHGFHRRRQRGTHHHYYDAAGRRLTLATHRAGNLSPELVDNVLHDVRRLKQTKQAPKGDAAC